MSRVPSNALRIAANTLNSPFIGTCTFYFYDQLKTNIQHFKAIELLEKQIVFPTTFIKNKKNAFLGLGRSETKTKNKISLLKHQGQEFILQTNLLPLNNVLRAKHFFNVQLTNCKFYFKNKILTGAKQCAPIAFFSANKTSIFDFKTSFFNKKKQIAFAPSKLTPGFELIKQLCFSSRLFAAPLAYAKNQKLSQKTKLCFFFTKQLLFGKTAFAKSHVLQNQKLLLTVKPKASYVPSHVFCKQLDHVFHKEQLQVFQKAKANQQQNYKFTKKQFLKNNKNPFLKNNKNQFLKNLFFAQKMSQHQNFKNCKNKMCTLFQHLFKAQFSKLTINKLFTVEKEKTVTVVYKKQQQNSFYKSPFLFKTTGLGLGRSETETGNKKWKTTSESWILKTNLFMLACVKNLCAKQVIGQTLSTKPQLLSVPKEAVNCLKTPLIKSDVNSSLYQLQTLAPILVNKQQLQNTSYELLSKTHLKQQINKKNSHVLTFAKRNVLQKQKFKFEQLILDNVPYNTCGAVTTKMLISRTFNSQCAIHSFILITGRLNKSLKFKKNKFNCFARTTINYNKTYFWHKQYALAKSKNALLFNLFYTGPTDIEPFTSFVGGTKKISKKTVSSPVRPPVPAGIRSEENMFRNRAGVGVMLRKTVSIRI